MSFKPLPHGTTQWYEEGRGRDVPWPPQFGPAPCKVKPAEADREPVLMHLTSSGPNHDFDVEEFPVNVQYTCKQCQWVSDPIGVKSTEAAWDTLPCPYCNP